MDVKRLNHRVANMVKSVAIDIEVNAKKLCLEMDCEWLVLLKNDRADEVEEILQEGDNAEVDRLVNGQFNENHNGEKNDRLAGISKISTQTDPNHLTSLGATYPWNIAAVHGSRSVLGVLLRCCISLSL